jgi:uncharacterized protein (DUF1330 family)
MPAYVVVEIDVKDPAAYEEYKPPAAAAVAAFGGRYLARGGATETLEGTWAPRRLVILEFPSAERARQWWNSELYRPAKAIRQACASAEMLLVEGVGP